MVMVYDPSVVPAKPSKKKKAVAKKAAPKIERRITVHGGDYIDALHEAAVAAESFGGVIKRIRTKRSRVIEFPKRITDKSGGRVFGAERLRPRTVGWTTKRTFVIVR